MSSVQCFCEVQIEGEKLKQTSLYRDPVILSNLFGLLVRFRLSANAIVADVEKAFLNVGLQVPDTDAPCFIWLKDSYNPEVNGNLIF